MFRQQLRIRVENHKPGVLRAPVESSSHGYRPDNGRRSGTQCGVNLADDARQGSSQGRRISNHGPGGIGDVGCSKCRHEHIFGRSCAGGRYNSGFRGGCGVPNSRWKLPVSAHGMAKKYRAGPKGCGVLLAVGYICDAIHSLRRHHQRNRRSESLARRWIYRLRNCCDLVPILVRAVSFLRFQGRVVDSDPRQSRYLGPRDALTTDLSRMLQVWPCRSRNREVRYFVTVIHRSLRQTYAVMKRAYSSATASAQRSVLNWCPEPA